MNNNVKIYKTWEDGFSVRRMTPDDAKLVESWFAAICPTAHDLSVTLSVFPGDAEGFYVGEYEGAVVASAIRIPLAAGVFYGSLYYVLEKYRGMGFGKRLRDDVATPFVGDNILTIDAHDNLLAMNRKRGYVDRFNVTEFVGAPKLPESPRSTACLKSVGDVDFDRLVQFDDRCFVRPGSDIRKRLLQKWVNIEGGQCSVAENAAGDVIGFGCRRPASAAGYHLIGPLYAESRDVALDIMRTMCGDLAATDVIAINICEPNAEALALVRELGLKDELHMIRMHLNGDPQELNPFVFGITSIDVCGF